MHDKHAALGQAAWLDSWKWLHCLGCNSMLRLLISLKVTTESDSKSFLLLRNINKAISTSQQNKWKGHAGRTTEIVKKRWMALSHKTASVPVMFQHQKSDKPLLAACFLLFHWSEIPWSHAQQPKLYPEDGHVRSSVAHLSFFPSNLIEMYSGFWFFSGEEGQFFVKVIFFIQSTLGTCALENAGFEELLEFSIILKLGTKKELVIL